MRGSIYYQSTQLVKSIFISSVKKEDRIDSTHPHFKCITSYNTMTTYRVVWENFFKYLKETWNLSNCELITEEHVIAYFYHKIEYYPSLQYLEKISSAFAALELALQKYSNSRYTEPFVYDFKIRKSLLNFAKRNNQVSNTYVNRTYNNVLDVIANLSCNMHKLAASLQLEGGARVEGVSLIKRPQLKGYRNDEISKRRIG